MPTLGQRLREAREKRGLSIAQLAAQTRINAHYFEAIENDDTDSLPGGFFYRSFVRQYARLLDLPESDYRHELERSLDSEVQTTVSQPSALPERRIELPRMPIGRSDPRVETQRWLVRLGALVLVITLCSGVFMLWQKWRDSQAAQLAQQQATLPQRAPAPKIEPPKPAQTVPESKPQDTPQPPADAAEPPAPQPSGPVRVIVRAAELTWVGVWQGQKQLFGDALQPGETRGFGSEDRLRVRLGNAGGVTVEWNGRVIPPPGPRGQVRTLDFWVDGYALVEPPPPKPTEPPPPQQ